MSADIQTNGLVQNLAQDTQDTQDTGAHYEAADQAQVSIEENVDLRDADFTRDGSDLVLRFENGEDITVNDYFSGAEMPTLTSADGAQLPGNLVQSFVKSGDSYDVAQNQTMSDASPVGSIQEVQGEVSITRVDGSVVQSATIGTEVYTGDIIETNGVGAANIVFSDETSFAVSENARLAIDEYVYDPQEQGEGVQNFSVLKGVFVFTSGLIGRDDPDDVEIATPSGSIGIRGTIIAGDVDAGEITVIEGAIVLRDFAGHEMTLATQFDTAKFAGEAGGIEHMGVMDASAMADKFSSISDVAPGLFSSIEDKAAESALGGEEEAIQVQDEMNDAPETADEAPQSRPEEAHEAAVEAQGETLAEGAEVLDTVEEAVAEEVAVELAEPMQIDAAAQDGKLETLKDMAFDADVDVATRIKAFKTLQATKDAIEEAQDDAAADDATMASEDITLVDASTFTVDQGPPKFYVGEADGSPDTIAAHQSHAIYFGNADENNFTNVAGGENHQNISFRGGDGNDTIDLYVDDSGSANFWSLNGGAGTEDTLNIFGTGGTGGALDFSNVDGLKTTLKGIEIINLNNGTNDTITLTGQGIIDNQSNDTMTLKEIVNVNGRDIDFSNVEVLKIEGDGGDTLNLELNSDWEALSATDVKDASGDTVFGYEGYYNADEGVTLIVNSAVNTDNVTGL